jgi:nicotinamidase-related amidase
MAAAEEEAQMIETDTRSTLPTWLDEWSATLADYQFAELVPDASRAAVVSTDMIVGFCSSGALASERVGAIATEVADLFQLAHDQGVRRFVLNEDTHHPEAAEFAAWPPHCIRGTEESETIPELAQLPFVAELVVFEKNSLSPAHGTEFDDWLEANTDLQQVIVVGNCTDLCVYTLAMHVRLWANAHNHAPFDVIVPENAVQTYDLPVDEAARIGAFPHPGDFFHWTFLYHMALNGIRVVRRIG